LIWMKFRTWFSYRLGHLLAIHFWHEDIYPD
jgi:hypothetical protein